MCVYVWLCGGIDSCVVAVYSFMFYLISDWLVNVAWVGLGGMVDGLLFGVLG